MATITFRSPDVSHAAHISSMVKQHDQLDDNSEYIYAIWCTYFAPNTAVALDGNEVLAFITGFRPPSDPQTFFLWQTCAKPRHGIPNLGVDLIQYAAEREIGRGARTIEASVAVDNKPIKLLMKTLCRRLGGKLETGVLFASDTLSRDGDEHHEEVLYRIELDAAAVQAIKDQGKPHVAAADTSAGNPGTGAAASKEASA